MHLESLTPWTRMRYQHSLKYRGDQWRQTLVAPVSLQHCSLFHLPWLSCHVDPLSHDLCPKWNDFHNYCSGSCQEWGMPLYDFHSQRAHKEKNSPLHFVDPFKDWNLDVNSPSDMVSFSLPWIEHHLFYTKPYNLSFSAHIGTGEAFSTEMCKRGC